MVFHGRKPLFGMLFFAPYRQVSLINFNCGVFKGRDEAHFMVALSNRVTASLSVSAVYHGLLTRVIQTEEVRAAKPKVTTLPLDAKALEPTLCSARIKNQIKPIDVTVSAGRFLLLNSQRMSLFGGCIVIILPHTLHGIRMDGEGQVYI